MANSDELETAQVPRDAARARPAALRLHVFRGGGVAATHDLPATGSLAIGRGSSSEIHVDDASVSRRHALLHLGVTLQLEDLDSANGTWVRHARVSPGNRVDVQPGDVIDVGSVMLVIQSSHRFVSAPHRPPAAQPGTPGADRPMENLNRVISQVAASDISVLLLGETGSGKEVCARTIHRLSARASRPFLGLNCAALSETLLESELFGHERGAFTGATTSKLGLFETAEGGTVLLDEVGELPLTVQARLLRVLETRELLRVGGTQPRPFNVRFVSATHRDLEAAILAHTFREDLYYRLAAFPLVVPPLRERPDELAGLAQLFIAQACQRDLRADVPTLSGEALASLQRQAWPGNIRELRNVIDHAVLLCRQGQITLEHLPADRRIATAKQPAVAPVPASNARAELRSKLKEVELQEIVDALTSCGGNQTRAAQKLGISRRTLVKRMTEHQLPRPRRPGGPALDDPA